MPQSSPLKIPETPAASFAAGRSGLLQRKSSQAAAPSQSSTEAPSIVNDVLRSPGQPLDGASRAFMEPRFGYDFSRVRVHADSRATKSAEAVNAQAYTVGSNIVFGPNQGGSGNSAHQRLLAHELAHVVQQDGRRSGGSLQVAPANDSAEVAADRVADQVLSGGQKSTRSAPGQIGSQVALQRQPKDPDAKEPVASASNKCPPFPAPGFSAIVTRSGEKSAVASGGNVEMTARIGERFNLLWSSTANANGPDKTAAFFGGLHWVQEQGGGALSAGNTDGTGTWSPPDAPGDATLVVRTVSQDCKMAQVKVHVGKADQPKPVPSTPKPGDPPRRSFDEIVDSAKLPHRYETKENCPATFVKDVLEPGEEAARKMIHHARYGLCAALFGDQSKDWNRTAAQKYGAFFGDDWKDKQLDIWRRLQKLEMSLDWGRSTYNCVSGCPEYKYGETVLGGDITLCMENLTAHKSDPAFTGMIIIHEMGHSKVNMIDPPGDDTMVCDHDVSSTHCYAQLAYEFWKGTKHRYNSDLGEECLNNTEDKDKRQDPKNWD
jgi:hypothetical protein